MSQLFKMSVFQTSTINVKAKIIRQKTLVINLFLWVLFNIINILLFPKIYQVKATLWLVRNGTFHNPPISQSKKGHNFVKLHVYIKPVRCLQVLMLNNRITFKCCNIHSDYAHPVSMRHYFHVNSK